MTRSQTRPPAESDPDEPVPLCVLVLVGFGASDFATPGGETTRENPDEVPNELRPWLDGYAFEDAVAVPGANGPVFYTDDGLGLAATGMGKANAAASVAALASDPGLDLSEARVLTAGVAATSPAAGTLGSVFVGDAVVDWDLKHRWGDGGTGTGAAENDDGERPIDLLAYRPRDYVYRLDEDLVADALRVAEGVDLADDEAARRYRRHYGEAAARGEPTVGTGTTVCGDEFWHGPTCAAQVEWLVEQYDAGTYVTAEMEDYGTATALDRFGLLDRYLSVRGVSNFDRPHPGQSVRESVADGLFLDLALTNTYGVASAVVDRLLA